jgi:Enolase C-terminal domain-like
VILVVGTVGVIHEEPIVYDNLEGYARLTADLKTPVQISQNFYGPRALYTALQMKASDYVMPDFMRIGGVTGWQRAAAIAGAAGIPISTHLYPEVAAHVMRVSETAHWLEWPDWANPILQRPYDVTDGNLHVPDVPGVGLEWDEKAVRIGAAAHTPRRACEIIRDTVAGWILNRRAISAELQHEEDSGGLWKPMRLHSRQCRSVGFVPGGRSGIGAEFRHETRCIIRTQRSPLIVQTARGLFRLRRPACRLYRLYPRRGHERPFVAAWGRLAWCRFWERHVIAATDCSDRVRKARRAACGRAGC